MSRAKKPKMNSNTTNERDNIIEFRSSSQFNIGIVICMIIFVYVIFRLLSYVTSDAITVYEVKEGSIVSDHDYRALIVRKEETVKSDMDGYVYYFAAPQSRVGAKTLVYAVDETGSIVSDLLNKETSADDLGDESFLANQNSISTFVNEYSDMNYQKTYSFKQQIDESLNALAVDSIVKKHKKEIKQAVNEGTYHSCYAVGPGLVSYMIDGLEDVTENDFDPGLFSGSESMKNLKSRSKIKKDDIAYKLIKSDDWKLVVPVDADMKEALKDRSSVQVIFDSDNISAWAGVSFLEKDDSFYVVLSLDDSMERYADLRFVNIEMVLEEKSGLKIPNSAITTKEFFTIPKSYFLTQNNSKDLGVLVKGQDDKGEFITPTIYKETKKYYYIDDEKVSKADELLRPDSKESYTVGTRTKRLEGVYNVNKGYAVFKQIEPLQENEDYTIIRSGTSYGIMMYDHIVLQGDNVKENEIIRR